MKKIPTLFIREFEEISPKRRRVVLTEQVAPGMEWVLEGKGDATVKYDGSACAVIGGVFYKRYDVKPGRKMPDGAIPCQEEADAVTGHFPCWVPCWKTDPSDKWFWEAHENTKAFMDLEDGTYEAVGKHFVSNPYHLGIDRLIPHGKDIVEVERTFIGIRDYLENHRIEGLVFWKDGNPWCKIRKKDYGFKWK